MARIKDVAKRIGKTATLGVFGPHVGSAMKILSKIKKSKRGFRPFVPKSKEEKEAIRRIIARRKPKIDRFKEKGFI